MPVHEVFAYLRLRDAARAIEFYTRAFGAKEKFPPSAKDNSGWPW